MLENITVGTQVMISAKSDLESARFAWTGICIYQMFRVQAMWPLAIGALAAKLFLSGHDANPSD